MTGGEDGWKKLKWVKNMMANPTFAATFAEASVAEKSYGGQRAR